MAAPTFVAQGTAENVTGNATVVWPVGHQADDIGVLLVETANQLPTTPVGWTLIESIGTGTAGAAGSVGLSVYWKRATSAAESSAVVLDVGDHIRARMLAFRGCETSGSPIEGTPVAATAALAAACSIAMPTTTVDECFAVGVVANATDTTANQTTTTTWADTSLTGVARIANGNVDTGVGGGIDAGGGTKAVAGAINNMTATLNTASLQAKIGFALKPPQVIVEPPVGNGGIYVATGEKATAGAVSTTTATSDNAAIQARLTFAIKPPTAPPVDLAPIIQAIPLIQGAVDGLVIFQIVASDPEGEDLVVTLEDGETAVPVGAVVEEDDSSGFFNFQWTPTAAQAGTWNFLVSADDGTNTTTAPVSIIVLDDSDTNLLQLAKDITARAEVDVESARALADILTQQHQMNAAVMKKVQDLVTDLEASLDYFESVSADLEGDENPEV